MKPRRLYLVELSDEPLDMTPAARQRRIDFAATRDDGHFFLPRGGLYRSRTAATERAALIESYGAKAVVYEADPAWATLDEARAAREQARRQARIDKLRAQIEALTALDEEAAS